MTQHDADQREFETWWHSPRSPMEVATAPITAEEFAKLVWHASRAALRAQQREATDMEIAEALAPVRTEWEGGGVMWMVPAVAAFRQALARLGLRVVQGAKPLGGGE